MRATITKEFKFEAAHCLPHHEGGEGKCARPHGHSYRVVVEIEGFVKEHGDEAGMVVDFALVKRVWASKLEPLLDHQDLNVTLRDKVDYTTAEEIAGWLVVAFRRELQDELVEGVVRPGGMDPPWPKVTAVTVYETASSSVTVRAPLGD